MATAPTQHQLTTSPELQKFKVPPPTSDESDFIFNREIGTSPPRTSVGPLAFGTAVVGNLVSLSNESRPIHWSQFSQQLNKPTAENKKKCESAIQKLLETAGKKNWDGQDADPVSQSAVHAAMKVAAMLSDSVETPEITADPHGNLEFDWNLENGTMFTISVGHSGEIAISGLNPNKARLRGFEENSESDSFYLLHCGLNWLVEMNGK